MASFKVEIKGDKQFNALLSRIKKRSPEHLDFILNKAAEDTRTEAVRSINAHETKGTTYQRGTVSHTASLPNNPPNTDTGNLVKNITKTQIEKGYETGSRKDAPYGLWLEFGTRKISPRPWLTPAYNRTIEKLKQSIQRRLNDGLL